MRTIHEEFGVNVKNRRNEMGLTQDALAAKSGVDRKAISYIEDGKKANPSLLTMFLLSEALEIELSELLIRE